MSVVSLPEYDTGLAEKVSKHYECLKAAEDLGALANFRKLPELNAAFASIADETVLAEYNRQKGGGERDDVPVKTAEFEMLDKRMEDAADWYDSTSVITGEERLQIGRSNAIELFKLGLV